MKSILPLKNTLTNLLMIILHVLSSKASLELTFTLHKIVNMLQEPVKLLKKEQCVLLYNCLLPFEGVTVYTHVTLARMDFPSKYSSLNCT